MINGLTKPDRVLIVKPSSLGDVITAIPVLRGLKRTFPDVHVAWVISNRCSDILAGEKELDHTILFERGQLGHWYRSPLSSMALMSFKKQLREGSFDWVIDLQGLLRSGIFTKWTKAPVRIGFSDAREGAPLFYTHPLSTSSTHTVDKNIELAQKVGIDARVEDMTLNPTIEAMQNFEGLCNKHNLVPGQYIVCVPPTRWITKNYPARHFQRVVQHLSRQMPILLTGGSAENDIALCTAIANGSGKNVFNLAGKTTIQDIVAIIRNGSGVICGDSAAKFIAAAVGTPCLTLIGPTQAERTGPMGNSRVLTAKVACQGCLKKRCDHITCMQSIKPDNVCEAVDILLNMETTTCLS